MVRALLAGTKTQTRRVVKPRKDCDFGCELWPHELAGGANSGDYRNAYCEPGDRLWVREAWRAVWSSDDDPPREFDASYRFWYEADAPLQDGYGKLRPSIHMPRCASRITLEITAVRVERLQDISEADSIAEGIERVAGGASCSPWKNYWLGDRGPGAMHCSSAVMSYRTLWESINGPGSWEANPWVWAVSFQRIKP
jgi:hypothetical protein